MHCSNVYGRSASFTREGSAKTDDKYDFINSKGVTSAWNGDREDVPA